MLKCNIECPLKFNFLLNLLVHSCALKRVPPSASSVQLNCCLKCTFNFNLKCTFLCILYRSQGTPLGVPPDKPSVASSVALTNAPSSAKWSATSNTYFLSTSYILNSFLKWTLRCTFKYNIKPTMKCTF